VAPNAPPRTAFLVLLAALGLFVHLALQDAPRAAEASLEAGVRTARAGPGRVAALDRLIPGAVPRALRFAGGIIIECQ
jgi:hypothetical protein